MRTVAFLALTLTTMMAGSVVLAEPTATTSSPQTYVCPKCGKVHVLTSTSTATPATYNSPVQVQPQVQPVSYQAPMASTSRLRATGGVTNVLAALNAQRARQGVPSLRYDPQLQAVAQRRAQQMASTGYKNHPPGSFSPGRYEGVGWSSSYSPSGVSACYTSDSRMRYAGAAMATGRDGVYFAVVYR